jgi:hypothetical protein
MAELATTKPIECNELGDKIKLEISPYYLEVNVGSKTYYFKRETGEFDGTSYHLRD